MQLEEIKEKIEPRPKFVGRVDYADEDDVELSGDAVADAIATEWRDYPLNHSKAAQLAASRHGLAMMGLTEDDVAENGTYPGITDDCGITLFCALCAADAGKSPGIPKEMKQILIRKTLSDSRRKLARHLSDFFDAFDLNPMDPEIYEVGFSLMTGARESEVEPMGDSSPGKPEEGDST